MTIHRLTWVQLGRRQAMDYADPAAAEDARMILESNTTISGLTITELDDSEPHDLSGPRQLGDNSHGVRVVVPYNDPRWQAVRRNGQQGRGGKNRRAADGHA